MVAANMYLLSGLLDAFDGHAARYFNQSKTQVYSYMYFQLSFVILLKSLRKKLLYNMILI